MGTINVKCVWGETGSIRNEYVYKFSSLEEAQKFINTWCAAKERTERTTIGAWHCIPTLGDEIRLW